MKKCIKSIGTAILTLFCMLSWIQGVFAAEPVTVRIPVCVNVAGDVPKEEERFRVVLTPESKNTPMPEGYKENCQKEITEKQTMYFPEIAYTVPGIYGYSVRMVKGNTANYTYDETIYYVRVTITRRDSQTLNATVSAHKDLQAGSHKQTITFENTYAAPKTGETVHSVKKDTSNSSTLIQTGQNKLLVWLFIGLGISCIGSSFGLMLKEKEKRAKRTI